MKRTSFKQNVAMKSRLQKLVKDQVNILEKTEDTRDRESGVLNKKVFDIRRNEKIEQTPLPDNFSEMSDEIDLESEMSVPEDAPAQLT